ncbi:MAG: PAS domain S-box protein [Nitrospirales bacterium]|nr:PAS domain S-box protein [Nitrospirales bacterium]
MDGMLRKSGIDILGNIRWGSHFCQFYETGEDLTDILVPYFKAGLESHEFCMWIVSAPISAEDALVAMRRSVPDIDDHIRKGQMVILPHTDWCLQGCCFDLRSLLNGWVKKLDTALAEGYEGLRVTGNAAWLERKDWRDFEEYEGVVNGVIGKYRMIALCTYSIRQLAAADVIDVARNHQFALIRRKGIWEVIRSGLISELALYTLAAIVESSNDAIIGKTPEGIIQSWNSGAERIYGYTAEEIIGQSILTTVPDEQKEEVRDIFRKIQKGEKIYPYETKRIRKDGSLIDVSITVSPIKDSAGRITGASAIVRDITEHKEAEEALQLALAYNRSLTEASLDPLVIISAEGKITDANEAMLRMTGHSWDEMIGTCYTGYVTEPEKAKEGFELVCREGEVKDYPLELRHRDGGNTPVLFNANLFKDKTGKVLGILAIARTMDAVIRLSEKRLRDITDALGEGVFVVDKQGYLTFMNPESGRLLGWTEAELKGRSPHELIHGHVGADTCPILGVFSSGALYSTDNDSFCRKNGTLFPVSYIASPIRENSEVNSVVVAFHDITERKSIDKRLKKYTKELERSNKELEQFAYVTSHDLQEPLRRIISFTDLLAQRYSGSLDEKADSYIRYIVSGATRMSILINDLLTYSRVTTRGKEFTPTDMEMVLSTVLRDLSVAIQESGAVITRDPLPTVMADDPQVGLLFQNLISNAIKFRGETPPAIHVSAVPIADFLSKRRNIPSDVLRHLQTTRGWVFSVRDRGIGIEPQYYERIFQIFQRLHTEEEYPGTGIGLAVCQKVVERHGGQIWVESEEGKGSTFCFTIPER